MDQQQTKLLPALQGGNGRLPALVLGALVLRLSFGMPYYLPGDSLNYLNGVKAFGCLELANTMHITRLGMVGPLALLEWLTRGVHPLLQLFPLVCSLAMVVLVYHLARVWAGETAALLAGGLMALVPMEIVYGTVLLPDTPLSFWALMAFWLLVRATGPRQVLGAGICLGLAYTCKETALFFAIPALAQAYARRRSIPDAACLVGGLAAVVVLEVALLWVLLGEPHLRVLQTVGFAYGSKGQFTGVEHTWQWWLQQVWLKLGALFWGGHLPTAALLLGLPHLLVLALVRHWRAKLSLAWWPALWLVVWWGQQLALSTIEPEPRYLQAGLPYAALLIALAIAPWWDQWQAGIRWALVVPALVLVVTGAGFFKLSFAPRAAATEVLYERLHTLAGQEPQTVVGGPSEYVLRLAEYAGLTTTLSQPDLPITHWARLSSGYSKEEAQGSPPAGMKACMQEQFALLFPQLYQRLGAVPALGLSSTAELYCLSLPPLTTAR